MVRRSEGLPIDYQREAQFVPDPKQHAFITGIINTFDDFDWEQTLYRTKRSKLHDLFGIKMNELTQLITVSIRFGVIILPMMKYGEIDHMSVVARPQGEALAVIAGVLKYDLTEERVDLREVITKAQELAGNYGVSQELHDPLQKKDGSQVFIHNPYFSEIGMSS